MIRHAAALEVARNILVVMPSATDELIRLAASIIIRAVAADELAQQIERKEAATKAVIDALPSRIVGPKEVA